MERRPSALADIEAAVAGKLAAALGDRPLRCPLKAIFFAGRRAKGGGLRAGVDLDDSAGLLDIGKRS